MIINKNKKPAFYDIVLKKYLRRVQRGAANQICYKMKYITRYAAAIINFTFSKINLKFVLDCIIGIG